MSQRPWDYYNDTQPDTEAISDKSKNQLIELGYEAWLTKEQGKGSYIAPLSHYGPQTVKEFLIDYRNTEKKIGI